MSMKCSHNELNTNIDTVEDFTSQCEVSGYILDLKAYKYGKLCIITAYLAPEIGNGWIGTSQNTSITSPYMPLFNQTPIIFGSVGTYADSGKAIDLEYKKSGLFYGHILTALSSRKSFQIIYFCE